MGNPEAPNKSDNLLEVQSTTPDVPLSFRHASDIIENPENKEEVRLFLEAITSGNFSWQKNTGFDATYANLLLEKFVLPKSAIPRSAPNTIIEVNSLNDTEVDNSSPDKEWLDIQLTPKGRVLRIHTQQTFTKIPITSTGVICQIIKQAPNLETVGISRTGLHNIEKFVDSAMWGYEIPAPKNFDTQQSGDDVPDEVFQEMMMDWLNSLYFLSRHLPNKATFSLLLETNHDLNFFDRQTIDDGLRQYYEKNKTGIWGTIKSITVAEPPHTLPPLRPNERKMINLALLAGETDPQLKTIIQSRFSPEELNHYKNFLQSTDPTVEGNEAFREEFTTHIMSDLEAFSKELSTIQPLGPFGASVVSSDIPREIFDLPNNLFFTENTGLETIVGYKSQGALVTSIHIKSKKNLATQLHTLQKNGLPSARIRNQHTIIISSDDLRNVIMTPTELELVLRDQATVQAPPQEFLTWYNKHFTREVQ